LLQATKEYKTNKNNIGIAIFLYIFLSFVNSINKLYN